jgi:hypothetical protein
MTFVWMKDNLGQYLVGCERSQHISIAGSVVAGLLHPMVHSVEHNPTSTLMFVGQVVGKANRVWALQYHDMNLWAFLVTAVEIPCGPCSGMVASVFRGRDRCRLHCLLSHTV